MDFRISISLENFFNDEKSFCYIFLDEKKYECIADLEAHLNRIFNIQADFCLMIDKYLLPSTENIRILKPDDFVSVKSTKLVKDNCTNYNKVRSCKEPEIVKEAEESADKCDKVSKKKKKKKTKRLADDDEAAVDSSFQTKIEEVENNDESAIKNVEKDSTMESLPYDYQPKSEVANEPGDMSISTKYLSGEETNNNSDHEDMPLDMDGLENMIIKRIEELKKSSLVSGDKLKQINETSSGRIIKRKRIRKRKKNNNIIQNIVPDVKNSMPSNSLLLIQGPKMSNHIRFDDSDKTIMQNGLSNRSIDKPRVVHAIESFTPDMNKLSHNNDREQDNNCPQTEDSHKCNNDSKNAEDITIENILPNLNKYKIIDSLPVQGVILFKMLTMADNYVPIVSEYILGRVLESHKDTNILKLSVIDGHKECQKPSGKFDLEEKCAMDNEIVEIEWSQVCEAKLIYFE